jgi:site-specific recombinase XerD
MACLILACGPRIQDVLSLRVQDVDLENLLLKIYGKGRKERMVPISPAARQVLRRWMKGRDASARGCSPRSSETG